jgi:hypothetical protein
MIERPNNGHVLVGERIQNNRVDHAVDRRGRHDPERECPQRDRRGPRLLQQLPQGEAKIVHKTVSEV